MIQIEIRYDQFNDKRGGRLNFDVKSESQDPPEVEKEVVKYLKLCFDNMVKAAGFTVEVEERQ